MAPTRREFMQQTSLWALGTSAGASLLPLLSDDPTRERRQAMQKILGLA